MEQRPPILDLRWLGDAYEQTQRARIDAGERIRAILQARDHTGAVAVPHFDASAALRLIRRGELEAPVSLLGWTYRRHWEEEAELKRGMEEALAAHPAWPWLSSVRGIGATLACRLLGRLDLQRAPTPSSFWAYCGLATIPGLEYYCATCELRLSLPQHARVVRRHRNAQSGMDCSGKLELAGGPDAGVRVAQPKPRIGERATYDRRAKKTCYLIGVSLVRSAGPYAALYRERRQRLAEERPGWPKARLHLTALRHVEKRFLADLWSAWSAAVSDRVAAAG
jgi:hypothetical protein